MAGKNNRIQIVLLIAFALLAACAPVPATGPISFSITQTPTSPSAPATMTQSAPTMAPATATPLQTIWTDVTGNTIGETEGWTNKVELADINGDGLVDILFANGGEYDAPGTPEFSQIFLNQGPGQRFHDASQQILGTTPALTRVIKVRDVNNDGQPDILMGTTYQTQSQLYLGDGAGNFTNVTATHLPQIDASIGDLEFGDADGDSDLDVVLADWGAGNPMSNQGGRTMLWLNDGTGHFSNATATQMPDILVRFSWELEFVDIDNDYDLDILVSCKQCEGGYLFENDGSGRFIDVTEGRLPQFGNNYDYEAMAVNSDEYLDLVTINDGSLLREHLLINNQHGAFEDMTDQLWVGYDNLGNCDDNIHVFLDFDSDGDADLLIGSLDCADRLLVNDGSGNLRIFQNGEMLSLTSGTLGIASADLNGDHKLDVVMAQGENAFPEKVYFGEGIAADTAPPVITLVESIDSPAANEPLQVHARIHDNKSPTMPHDWQSVVARWTVDGQTQEIPMQWYGEYLWRGTINESIEGEFSYEVCATDAAGNETCSAP